MSGDDRPVRQGIVETQGKHALSKRVDVIRETIRGLRQGHQLCGAARPGRTHERIRPVLINTQKPLAPQGPSPPSRHTDQLASSFAGKLEGPDTSNVRPSIKRCPRASAHRLNGDGTTRATVRCRDPRAPRPLQASWRRCYRTVEAPRERRHPRC